MAAKKRQNKITDIADAAGWRGQGIMTAGYILGVSRRCGETIRRDIAIIQKELPLDALEVFLSYAAARLGGPPGPLEQRHCDGCRPQPIRRGACMHRHPKMTKKEWGRNSIASVVPVLHTETHGDDHAARGGDWHPDEQPTHQGANPVCYYRA